MYIRASCLRLNSHPKSSTIDPLVDFLLGQQHEFSSSLLVSRKGQHHLRYHRGRSSIAQQSRAIHSPAEWSNKLLINDCTRQHSEDCLDREEDGYYNQTFARQYRTQLCAKCSFYFYEHWSFALYIGRFPLKHVLTKVVKQQFKSIWKMLESGPREVCWQCYLRL